jgi:hypothetical protein
MKSGHKYRTRVIAGAATASTLALALVASTSGGLAAGSAPLAGELVGMVPSQVGTSDASISLPELVGKWVDLSRAQLVGEGISGRAVFIAPGAAENAGMVCMFSAKAGGATSVVAVTCNPPDIAAAKGIDLEESLGDGSLSGVHVRVPAAGSPVLRLFRVGAAGGRVSIESGDRTVVLSFPNLSDANSRADRDLAKALEAETRIRTNAPR